MRSVLSAPRQAPGAPAQRPRSVGRAQVGRPGDRTPPVAASSSGLGARQPSPGRMGGSRSATALGNAAGGLGASPGGVPSRTSLRRGGSAREEEPQPNRPALSGRLGVNSAAAANPQQRQALSAGLGRPSKASSDVDPDVIDVSSPPGRSSQDDTLLTTLESPLNGATTVVQEQRRETGGGMPSPAALPHLLTELQNRIVQLERQECAPSGASGGGPRPPPAIAKGAERAELELLRACDSRLEQEVADLRAQVARRLDQASREVEAARRESEEARAEASALRAEVAELQLMVAPATPSDMTSTAGSRQQDDGLTSQDSGRQRGPPVRARLAAPAGQASKC